MMESSSKYAADITPPTFIFKFSLPDGSHRFVGTVAEFNQHWNQLYSDYGLARIISQLPTRTATFYD